jgi:hypothetical protein
MIDERFSFKHKRKVSGFEATVMLVFVVHMLGFLAAIGLSDPKARIYSPELRPDVWLRVLSFPLVTIHNAFFDPRDYGVGVVKYYAVRFWMGGNSLLWGLAVALIGRRLGRMGRSGIWKKGSIRDS